MPQLVKKRRSGWAVLAAGALVASLLAVGASPAGAAQERADHTTKLSACVGDALNDQLFTDVSDDHVFKDAINCIAYYDISRGTGDGSTFSPNDDVTRAQMALFIARAAEAAGVDLGDAMSAGFTDIGDTWSEARDAINRLGSKGIIPKGGAYRPDDAVTRAEMATFLVGLLNKASSIVTINSAGKILLGTGGSAAEADDWFPDSRASLPRANDAEVSAIYELGVTKGASATANASDTKSPLGFNYEPAGTVSRGQMAAFITRALAHTSVRPEGISVQYDGSNVVVSARDADFMPRSNVVVDVFHTDTASVDLAFRTNGTCDEVNKIGTTIGAHACEIDSADPITGGDGDASLAFSTIADSGTTVWVWTGDNKATVKSGTDLYRLDIPKTAAASTAARVRVSTEFAGKKAKLGSSVLYTVQLLTSNNAPAKNGTDGKKPASFLVTLRTFALVDHDNNADTTLIRNPQGASVVTTLPLTTDGDGKATFSVSGLPDPAPDVKGDKYQVDIWIQPRPNAPAAGASGGETYFIGATGGATVPSTETGSTGLVEVRAGAVDDDAATRDGLVFSTEASSHADATVSVKPVNKYVAASARGASNRATVTVTDQYGDPIAGAKVFLTSNIGGTGDSATSNLLATSAYSDINTVPAQTPAVGRDGTFTFGWTRTAAGAATETLTAYWRYRAADPNANPTVAAGRHSGTATVEWATVARTGDGNNPTGTDQNILHADKDTNMIFVGAAGGVIMVSYDSNDRYNIDPAGDSTPLAASTYAAFEKSITASETASASDNLTWSIAGSGSRTVNTWTLLKAGSG